MIFPLITKPIGGSGSKNVFLFKKKDELQSSDADRKYRIEEIPE